MSLYQEALKNLKQAKIDIGVDLLNAEQGSEEWFRGRLGVITASRADSLLAKPGTAKRDGYLAELVAEVLTAKIPDEINAKALRWGKDHEDEARDAYSAINFSIIEQVPLIYKPGSNYRFACSPDGLDGDRGLELKCPWSSRTFVEFMCADKIKPEYEKQCQYSMWVTGAMEWAFYNYDPRMKNCKKLHGVIIKRDEAMMREIADAAELFIDDMDKMLSKAGVKFGEQW